MIFIPAHPSQEEHGQSILHIPHIISIITCVSSCRCQVNRVNIQSCNEDCQAFTCLSLSAT